jgi:hypothetical protein
MHPNHYEIRGELRNRGLESLVNDVHTSAMTELASKHSLCGASARRLTDGNAQASIDHAATPPAGRDAGVGKLSATADTPARFATPRCGKRLCLAIMPTERTGDGDRRVRGLTRYARLFALIDRAE